MQTGLVYIDDQCGLKVTMDQDKIKQAPYFLKKHCRKLTFLTSQVEETNQGKNDKRLLLNFRKLGETNQLFEDIWFSTEN